MNPAGVCLPYCMADRYLIYEQLGAGGVGTVYRAFDSQLHRWVAIKRLTIQEGGDDQGSHAQEQLRQEAESLASLRNPNIVSIYDVASDEQGLFMVMELLEGEDLTTVVARGPLPYEDFKELARQTLEGLIAAHERHLLHRDIKPENIKVERLPGGRLQSKIIDFGLARIGLSARKQTEDVTGSVMGSIHYMAPEQLSREPVSARTDLYSLGCVFYEALSGQKAFIGPSMSDVIDKHLRHEVLPLASIAPHVPPWLGAWVERLMARDPSQRPQSAQQAIEEFRAWERQPPMVPYPAPPAAPQFIARSVAQEEPIAVAVVIDEPAPPRPTRLPASSSTAQRPRAPAHTPSATTSHPPPAATKSKVPLIVGAVSLLAIAGFFLLRGGQGSSTIDAQTQDTMASSKAPVFDLPTDRLMPPVDEDRVLHLIADVGTLQSTKSSDGKPFPAYANDSVAQWHDVAPRGGNNFLISPSNSGALPPQRLVWPVNASGPSVKGNRAALQLRGGSSGAAILEGRFSSQARAFPMGGDAIKAARGATLALVFQIDAGRAGTIAQTSNANGEVLRLEATGKGSLMALVKGASNEVRLESSTIQCDQPTIAVVAWNPDKRQLFLLAINPVPAPNSPNPSFQKAVAAPLPPASTALDQVAVGPCNGLLAELMVYGSALDESQSRLLANTQLRSHYFK